MMNRITLALCALLLASGTAQAQSPFRGCPAIVSREAFLKGGGTLKLTRLPGVPQKICMPVAVPDETLASKSRFVTRCEGSVQFHVVVHPDGSVKWGSVGHVRDAGMSPILSGRVDAIRFAPPRLDGAPVCVMLDVMWESSVPGKFSLVGETR